MNTTKIPQSKSLYPHQKEAVEHLRTGSILCGGVGSGKSLTALEYFYRKIPPWTKLFIITTARKRDTKDWEKEAECYPFFKPPNVDSWNNIKKYIDISGAFFIFDEQRVIGNGVWVRSFLKIVKNNDWVLLTATPGDSWLDYIPAFIANGFYKNRSHFIARHVIFKRFVKFPVVDRYVDEGILERLKEEILVKMDYKNPAELIYKNVVVDYDKEKIDRVFRDRWDIDRNKPLQNVSAMLFAARKIVNSDSSRFGALLAVLEIHKKVLVFYNFNYELDILKKESSRYSELTVSEWNGHKHEPIPDSEFWMYFVQYTAGNEGWNCTKTNAVLFYSLNYSYRVMLQSAGRIDRLNTPFSKLYCYRLFSHSFIDVAILDALAQKKNFNEKEFERICSNESV